MLASVVSLRLIVLPFVADAVSDGAAVEALAAASSESKAPPATKKPTNHA